PGVSRVRRGGGSVKGAPPLRQNLVLRWGMFAPPAALGDRRAGPLPTPRLATARGCPPSISYFRDPPPRASSPTGLRFRGGPVGTAPTAFPDSRRAVAVSPSGIKWAGFIGPAAEAAR